MPFSPKNAKVVEQMLRHIWTNNISAMSLAIDGGFDLNNRDRDGRPLLMEAVVRGTDEMLELLLKRGGDPNLQDNSGFSALHFAAQDYKLNAAEVLLRAGAKVDLRDSHGNTPLFRAVFDSKGRGDMIKLLLQHGADPLAKNDHGVSPPELANTIANYDVKQFFQNI